MSGSGLGLGLRGEGGWVRVSGSRFRVKVTLYVGVIPRVRVGLQERGLQGEINGERVWVRVNDVRVSVRKGI